MTTTNAALRSWVADTAKLTQPERIHWCDGSEAENRKLIEEMCEAGTLSPLNQQNYPGCYLHLASVHLGRDAPDHADAQHAVSVGQRGDARETRCETVARRPPRSV